MKDFRFLTLFVFILILSINSSAVDYDVTHYLIEQAKETYHEYGNEIFQKQERSSYKIGDIEMFYAFEPATMKYSEVYAELKNISSKCLIYVEQGYDIKKDQIEVFVSEFENNIYPTDRRYFGSENIPGIDNEERITILFLDIKDGYNPDTSKGFIAGYYMPENEFSKEKKKYSNEREMLYIDIYPGNPSSEFTLSVIAHEFQHMIHWNNDKEEEIWLNEGFSQLAINLCGYRHPSQIYRYAENPEISLTLWHPAYMAENYGIVYLFKYYIMNRFFKGDKEKFTRGIVSSKEHGINSIKTFFDQNNIKEYFDDIYIDFIISCLLNNSSSQYFLHSSLSDFKIKPVKFHTDNVKGKRDGIFTYGADFIMFTSNEQGNIKFEFDGVVDNGYGIFKDDVEYRLFAVKFNSEYPEVNSIEEIRTDSSNDAEYYNSEIGSIYDTIVFIPFNLTLNDSIAYKYSIDFDKKNNKDKLPELEHIIKKAIKSGNTDKYFHFAERAWKIEIEY